jgi:hypothetical protein
MPVLDRQAAPSAPRATGVPGAAGAAAVRTPDRVPETAPTPLQRQYINLSAIALVAGFIAITALETGSTLSSWLVKLCVLVGGPVLLLTTADAALRFWRSAWAWMAVDRNRGLFRLTWVAVAGIGLVVVTVAWVAVLLA